MPIIVVGNEKNFAALAPRLFGAKVSSTTAGEVADQVRLANPHANLDELTPGTVLTIPETPAVRVQGEVSLDEPTVTELKGLGDQGRALLAGIVTAAGRREAETRKERARAIESLDSIGTGTRRGEKGLTKELTAARNGLDEEDERAKQRTKTLKRAQAEWTVGLDALLQRLD